MTPRNGVGAAFLMVLLAFAIGPARAAGPTAGSATGTAFPLSDDALVAAVRTAVANHDLDFFENHLIDWAGARKRTQRLTLFQIRECFGRPIKSVGLEPLTPNPAGPLVPEGYRTNLPVTHLLRIAFDEQHAPDETPACVFMLSKDPKGSYRMALVLSNAPPPK